MTTMYKTCKLLATILVLIGLTPGTALAYVDPGSGSVIVTTVLGLIAAVGYTCRKYFYKAKRKLLGARKEDESEDV